jgi:hypothetical protein
MSVLRLHSQHLPTNRNFAQRVAARWLVTCAIHICKRITPKSQNGTAVVSLYRLKAHQICHGATHASSSAVR